jgi:uncharacterized protein (TIGR03435 family)
LVLQSPEDAKLPTFEVATVKPIDPKARRNFIDAQIFPGGRILLKSQHLTALAALAWMLPAFRVQGPKDINMYGFTIEAKPPEDDSNSRPTVQAMGVQFPEISMLRLRALIIERFHLKYHLENREHLAYDLVVSKGGHSLQTAPLSKDYPLSCRPTNITSRGRTMAELTARLGEFYLQTDVYDKTGLTDAYEFSFSFEPLFTASPPGDPLPTIFESIHDTLGLKLVPHKEMAKFLVIDHFEQPTAN